MFWCPRPVPFALKDGIEREFDMLQSAGIIDNILIIGVDNQEHLANLKEVLRRLQYHGIMLKKNKCKFMCDHVE